MYIGAYVHRDIGAYLPTHTYTYMRKWTYTPTHAPTHPPAHVCICNDTGNNEQYSTSEIRLILTTIFSCKSTPTVGINFSVNPPLTYCNSRDVLPKINSKTLHLACNKRFMEERVVNISQFL